MLANVDNVRSYTFRTKRIILCITCLPFSIPSIPSGSGETVSKKFEPRTINILQIRIHYEHKLSSKLYLISRPINLHVKKDEEIPLPNSVLPPFFSNQISQIYRTVLCAGSSPIEIQSFPERDVFFGTGWTERGSGITDVSNDAERRKPSGGCLLQAWGVATGGRVVSEPSELW